MLSIGMGRGGKGTCYLHWSDAEECGDGLIAMLNPGRAGAATRAALYHFSGMFGHQSYMALSIRRRRATPFACVI